MKKKKKHGETKYELVGGFPKARSTRERKPFGKRNQALPF